MKPAAIFTIMVLSFTSTAIRAQGITILNNFAAIGSHNVESQKCSKECDSIKLLLKKTIQEKDSMQILNMQKDSSIKVWTEKYKQSNCQNKILEDSLAKNQCRIGYLEQIIQRQKKGNFLPLGIKQFKNNHKVLGYTFLVSEIAVPIALGIGFENLANKNYNKHKLAQTRPEHSKYYNDYKKYHHASIWTPIVAFAGIYAVNILCNYWTKIDLKPTCLSDSHKNLGLGMSVGIKF